MAGVVTRRAWSTGTEVSVGRSEEFGLDPADGGAWTTQCETHGSNVQHESLRVARSWASCPEGWCEECQEIDRAGNARPRKRTGRTPKEGTR